MTEKTATLILKKVDLSKTELEGPYECPGCGGHMMLDATFLEQVELNINCPYCGIVVRAPEEL